MAETSNINLTLIRRLIGRRFRLLRTACGLTLEQARKKVGISESTLVRLEAGSDGVRLKEMLVEQMFKIYGVSEEDQDELRALAAETRLDGSASWWHSYHKTALPGWFGLYVTLEDSAETISLYEAELVPGLLQTRAYATQIMAVPAGLIDAAESERRVDVRMARQSLLTRARAPKIEVVLSEAAISRLLGMGHDIAREQLQHLLDVAHRANIELRVVPWTAGVHGGMASSGGFSLLHFPPDPSTGEPIEPPLAYVDSLTGAMYLVEASEVGSYALVWHDLLTRALNPEASLQHISTVLEGLTP